MEYSAFLALSIAPSSRCKAGSEQALCDCATRTDRRQLVSSVSFGLPLMLGNPRKNFRYAEKISLLKNESKIRARKVSNPSIMA